MAKKKRRKARNLDPEPGGWVMDTAKNMPKLTPPPELPEGKLETAELRDQWVAYEGLGYCIYEIIPASKIADPKLRTLWTRARKAMQDIVEHMG
ncbi:MAG: hypothetical protein ACYS7Y_04175 [Planctomycetota bacterium]|jgi:hypothetical protein